MNSRERILSAIRRQPVDHVPLFLRLWSLGEGTDNIPFNWRDQFCRVEALLKLGVDDTLLLEAPLGYPENYHADQCQGITFDIQRIPAETPGGTDLLKKKYHTPEGDLCQVVRLTDDWPHGEDIMLFSDFNIPRYVEPIIKTLDDVKRIKFLLADPNVEQMAEFKQRSKILHSAAERLGVVLDGGWTALGDSLIWLCGMQNVLYWQMDQPEVLEAFLDVLVEWELKRTALQLDEGVDVIVHSAWYEGTDFFTPRIFRRLIKPRLKKLIDLTHARGALFRYIITKGWKPLRSDLIDLGIDCITGVDPIQDRVDLAEVKAEIGGKICLMGGVNAAVMLTQFSDEEICAAIDEAMHILSQDDGFILFPVDNIHCELPWEKTKLVIKHWKKFW